MSKTRSKHCVLEDERNVGNAVRNTVRNMAYNLENVITNLHGIVGDLHVLVAQIDSVTNRIDGRNGMKRRENGRTTCLSSLDGTNTKTPPQGILSNNIKHWQTLIETYETPDFSPDLDWSYLGLTESEKAESKERLSSLSDLRKVSKIPQSTNTQIATLGLRLDEKAGVLHSNNSSLKGGDITELSPSSDISSVGGACCDSDSSLPYSGYYETIVDGVLENMACEDDDSDFSDDEYILSPDVQTSSSSSASDDRVSSVSSVEFQAEYDRHVNPWTTFSTVVNAVDSEDAFSVDDILNDNYIESSYYNYSFDDSFKTLEVS
ncbi:hypothetical protein SNE40_011714 [Patella caerulea]|uniref:Uncharacterized protein n=1 Tax=Patella caerulea TaxID=87958 RepID=A0AAN8JJZ4_PATCE